MTKKIIIGVVALFALVAVSALAQNGSAGANVTTNLSTSTQVDGSGKLPKVKTTAMSAANLACVQSAVDAREQATASAFSTFSASESASLSTRASALHTAWGTSDGTARRAAVKAAWSAYRTANKTAFSALRASKKSAWEAFRAASKTCHVSVVENSAPEGAGSLGL